MTWSAGKTAMTPVVERAPTSAAPSVTAAQVSRPTGSAMRFCLGIFGSCLRTSGNCASLVMTKMFLTGTSGSTRSTACWRNERLPSSGSSCLGIFSRLTGQNRSPRPPAMMMTKRFLYCPLLLSWFQTRIKRKKQEHFNRKSTTATSYLNHGSDSEIRIEPRLLTRTTPAKKIRRKHLKTGLSPRQTPLLKLKFFVDKISHFAQPLTNSAGKLKQERTQQVKQSTKRETAKTKRGIK